MQIYIVLENKWYRLYLHVVIHYALLWSRSIKNSNLCAPVVREDAHLLYGFRSEMRKLFLV